MPEYTPVYVVTGFLDSGKTSLLNRLLSRRLESGHSLCCIQFEQGEQALEQDLIDRGNLDLLHFPVRKLQSGAGMQQVSKQIYDYLLRNDPEELWIDLKDTATYEYILGPPNTVLGRTARDSLREAGVEPLGLDTYLSAAFAAAVAREGVALAFTYRSCRVMRDGFRYLRIGKEGIFLDLALVWPAGKYRSRAAKALADLLHEMAPELLHR